MIGQTHSFGPHLQADPQQSVPRSQLAETPFIGCPHPPDNEAYSGDTHKEGLAQRRRLLRLGRVNGERRLHPGTAAHVQVSAHKLKYPHYIYLHLSLFHVTNTITLNQIPGLGAPLPAVFIRAEKNLAGRHQRDRHPGPAPHPAADVAIRLVGRGVRLAGRPVRCPVGGDLRAGTDQEGGDDVTAVAEVR